MIRRVIAFVAVAAALLAGSPQPDVSAQFGPAPEGISPQAQAQIAAILREKAFRTSAQRKLDTQLLFAQRMARGQAVASGVSRLEVDLPMAAGNRVVVDVRASVSPALVQRIRAQGIRVVREEPAHDTLRLEATFDQLDALTEMPEVRFVQPRPEAVTSRAFRDEPAASVPRPRRRPIDRAALRAAVTRAIAAQDKESQVGVKQSEGDVTHRADVSREAFYTSGQGVRIGVLSDGVRNLASAQATGDVGPVTIHGVGTPDDCGTVCDEGTALLEIVHDIAPNAQLFFASAFVSITDFADNIRALRNTYGCDIIIDDVSYYVESPFQDGQSASVSSVTNGGAVIQAVKDVTAAGALHFSSAGNNGNVTAGTSGTWEGDFSTGANIAISGYGVVPMHRFTGTQDFNVLTAPGQRRISLYWSDPLGVSSTDYDLFLLDSTGSTIVAASAIDQSGFPDPFEFLAVPPSVTAENPGLVVIVQWSGSAKFLHLSTGRGRLSVSTTGAAYGHSATSAPNSFGVAATPAVGPYPAAFNASNTVQAYSSDGPRRIFFDADGLAITPGNVSSTGGLLLNKPDLTAADCVSVTGTGGFGGTPPVFCGTSASAAHAGAIAALIKSSSPWLTAALVRTALLGSAVDIHAAGVDRNSGAGIVMADTGVQNAMTPLMANDAPAPGATVTQPFNVAGWAIDRSSITGTGVDLVQVYAQRSGASPQLLGNASYGSSRPDVGDAYGSRFADSGYSFTASGLWDGSYTLIVYARSTRTGLYQSQSVGVTVRGPAMAVDTPFHNTTVDTSFTISGWAVDRAATSGTGVDLLHVWAFPQGSGAGQFVGQPTYGAERGDIGDLFGSQFTNSGFSLDASLAPGTYVLVVYSHSSVTGRFEQVIAHTITVQPPTQPYTYIDQPAFISTRSASAPFEISGWALDRGATSGTGVAHIHVWAFQDGSPPGTFVGVGAYGEPRPDVAAAFDEPRFTNSGYSLTVPANTFAAGTTWFFVVFANSTVTGGFTHSAGTWVSFID